MGSTTIYLLDDNQDMLSLLNDMLADIGLKTLCFNSGKVFFEQVTEFDKKSLLVLDLCMPDMDGIEVMRRLASMPNPPSLVLISGHDLGVLQSAVKLGKAHRLEIIASLDKPISLKKFQKILFQYYGKLAREQVTAKKHTKSALLSNELLEAIEQDQLVLHFQPQIEIKTNKLVSCEALVRWQHPDKGLIFPDQFIDIAEQNGWMGELTTWVLKNAVKQGKAWLDNGFKIPISVNVSADNVTSLLLPEQISEFLNAEELMPSMLTLEVTESALMGELITSLDILTRLRLKGLALSIDDFGTGYSSLSQLHKIPFSELKIDKSFISLMIEDNEAKAIVKTCIMLGHELDMLVVAEGVETENHLELLNELQCDIAQGYLYSRPIPAVEFEKWSKSYI